MSFRLLEKMISVFHLKVKNSFGFGLVSIIWVTVLGKTGPWGLSSHWQEIYEKHRYLYSAVELFS